MEDTLKLALDSALHTAESILHGVPGEASDWPLWAGWAVASGMLLFILFKYMKTLKRKP